MSVSSRDALSHEVSPRSLHSRPTDLETTAVSPGQRVLTASFATRGSRVQIPSAPQIDYLVRLANSALDQEECTTSRISRTLARSYVGSLHFSCVVQQACNRKAVSGEASSELTGPNHGSPATALLMVARLPRVFVARWTRSAGSCWRKGMCWQDAGTTRPQGLSSSPTSARSGWRGGAQLSQERPSTTPRFPHSVTSS